MSTYKVKKGDTLSKLAKARYGDFSSMMAIAAANGIVDPDKIEVGQVLKMPKTAPKRLDLDEIPIKDKSKIITDYQKYYDYLVEGNKVYSRIKGTDDWRDISNNKNAVNAIQTHIANTTNTNQKLQEKKQNKEEVKDSVPVKPKITEIPKDTIRNLSTIDNPFKYTNNDSNDVFIPKTITPTKSKSKVSLDEQFNFNQDNTINLPNIQDLLNNQSTFTPTSKYKTGLEENNTYYLRPTRPDAKTYQIYNSFVNQNKTKNKSQDENRGLFKANHIVDGSATIISDFTSQALGYLIRQYNKDYAKGPETDYVSTKRLTSTNTEKNDSTNRKKLEEVKPKYPGSAIDTIPMTKDNVLHGFAETFKPTKNHYYAAENINLNDVKLGYRSRGDETPLKSQGIIITTYQNGNITFSPLTKNKGTAPKNGSNWDTGYVGVDKNGKFVAGTYNEDSKTRDEKIKNGAMVASTPYMRVKDIPKINGKYVLMNNTGISRNRKTIALDGDYGDGVPVRTAFNIMLGRNNETNTYGDISGGRVVMRVGDEHRLVSGSIDQIYQAFQDMKKRHKSDYVDFFMLDNGTYNKAIRTFNGVLDSNTLHMYDMQNSPYGGNGLYLK